MFHRIITLEGFSVEFRPRGFSPVRPEKDTREFRSVERSPCEPRGNVLCVKGIALHTKRV
jgi:hypothetical protein